MRGQGTERGGFNSEPVSGKSCLVLDPSDPYSPLNKSSLVESFDTNYFTLSSTTQYIN